MGLGRAASLRSFSLFLSDCPGKICLKNFLADAQGLKSLTLTLVHCQTEGLKALLSGIAKNTRLESLSLDLSHNQDITDVSTSSLSRLEVLKTLRLHFKGCRQIANFDLCSSFTDAMPLESIDLSVAFCEKMKHPSMLGLESLPKLKTLKHFGLDLSGCSSVKGIADLKTVLSKISSLETIEVMLVSGGKYTSVATLEEPSAAQMARHLPLAIESFNASTMAFMVDQQPAAAHREQSPTSPGQRRSRASSQPVATRSASEPNIVSSPRASGRSRPQRSSIAATAPTDPEALIRQPPTGIRSQPRNSRLVEPTSPLSPGTPWTGSRRPSPSPSPEVEPPSPAPRGMRRSAPPSSLPAQGQVEPPSPVPPGMRRSLPPSLPAQGQGHGAEGDSEPLSPASAGGHHRRRSSPGPRKKLRSPRPSRQHTSPAPASRRQTGSVASLDGKLSKSVG